jgi:hypothetical protein
MTKLECIACGTHRGRSAFGPRQRCRSCWSLHRKTVAEAHQRGDHVFAVALAAVWHDARDRVGPLGTGGGW